MFQATLKLFEVINVNGDVDRKMKDLGLAITEQARRKGQTYSKGGQFWNRICQSIGFVYSIRAKTLTYGAKHLASEHKQYGGIISAPGKGENSRFSKYLAIPIADESKGKSIGYFNKPSIKGFFFTSRKGNLIFAMPDKKAIAHNKWIHKQQKGMKSPKLKGNSGDQIRIQSYFNKQSIFSSNKYRSTFIPLFVLKKSVYQKAQPYFPEGAELDAIVTKHLGGEIKK